MARKHSWLPRLRAILQTVEGSVRSHYERRDLELLFQVQPRAANMLLAILPTEKLGQSLLVKRDDLERFLREISQSPNETEAIDRQKQRKASTSRKVPRTLYRRDEPPIELGGLPETVKLSRGELYVRFVSEEDLCRSLIFLGSAMREQPVEFRELYVPVPDTTESDRVRAEVEALLSEQKREFDAWAERKRAEKASNG